MPKPSSDWSSHPNFYPARLRRITAEAGRVVLAIDGLQPGVGHEVRWAFRDVLSREILLARSLLFLPGQPGPTPRRGEGGPPA